MLIVHVVFVGITLSSLNCMTIISRPETKSNVESPLNFTKSMNETIETLRFRRQGTEKGSKRILVRTKNITFEPTTEEERRQEQDIVFPDSPPNLFNAIDKPPKCAEHQTFCENIDFYPHQLVSDVIKKSNIPADFFEADEMDISNRNAEDDEHFVCGSSDTVIFPKYGKTKSNKWKLIINQDDSKKFTQGVRIETCLNPDRPCDILDSLPLGYTTSCKQKYVYRRLFSLTDNAQPVKEVFLMPSACCCSYRKNLSVFGNFRAPTSPLRRRDR